MKQIITITMMLFSIASFSQDISGKWSGTVDRKKSNPVVFNFDIQKKDETYSTTIDIPALRVTNLKPKETTFSNNALIVDGMNLGFSYQGNFNQNLQQIEGTFTEGLNVLPLILKKVEIKIENSFRRPQEPVKPFPYKEKK